MQLLDVLHCNGGWIGVTHQMCLVLWTWRKLADETNAKNAHKICQDYPYAKDGYKLVIAIYRTRMTILEQGMNADV